MALAHDLMAAVVLCRPVLFVIVISFFVVKNYRMTKAFEFVNWVRMLTRGYFWDSYSYTLFIASLSASIAKLVAFPAAWALAFCLPEAQRRRAVFLLIILFFTSYLVRTFAWYVILAESGVLNAMLGFVGLGPFKMFNTHFGPVIGYLTLTLLLAVFLTSMTLVILAQLIFLSR